jgi:hypothetical protein
MKKNQTAHGNSFSSLLLEPVEITAADHLQLVAGGLCKNVCTVMQGNRVNVSRCDEACQEVVIPCGGLAPAAQGVLSGRIA